MDDDLQKFMIRYF